MGWGRGAAWRINFTTSRALGEELTDGQREASRHTRSRGACGSAAACGSTTTMLKRVTEPLGPFPGTGPMPSLQDDLTQREEPSGREWEGPGAAGVSSCASAPAPPERAPAPQLLSWGRGTTRAQLVHVCERRARTRSQFLLPGSGSQSLTRRNTPRTRRDSNKGV